MSSQRVAVDGGGVGVSWLWEPVTGVLQPLDTQTAGSLRWDQVVPLLHQRRVASLRWEDIKPSAAAQHEIDVVLTTLMALSPWCVTELSLVGVPLLESQFQMVLQLLRNNTSMADLRLDDSLGNDAVFRRRLVDLFGVLASGFSPQLRSLNVHGVLAVDDALASALVRMLRHNQTLRELFTNFTKMPVDALQQLIHPEFPLSIHTFYFEDHETIASPDDIDQIDHVLLSLSTRLLQSHIHHSRTRARQAAIERETGAHRSLDGNAELWLLKTAAGVYFSGPSAAAQPPTDTDQLPDLAQLSLSPAQPGPTATSPSGAPVSIHDRFAPLCLVRGGTVQTDAFWILVDSYLHKRMLSTQYERAFLLCDESTVFVNMWSQLRSLQMAMERAYFLRALIGRIAQLARIAVAPLAQMQNEANDADMLHHLLNNQMARTRRFYGSNLSDDSDDDEIKEPERASERNPSARMNQILRDQNFFDDVGRTELLHQLNSQFSNLADAPIDIPARLARVIQAAFTRRGQTRGSLVLPRELSAQQRADLDQMNRAISAGQALPPTQTRFFVAQYRGINYMRDRWRSDCRRFHRAMNEIDRAQYSEALLHTLPFSIYTQLSANSHHHTAASEHILQHNDAKLAAVLQANRHSGPVVGHDTSPYLFSNLADCMQDEFSNGIDDHLKHLRRLRCLPNAAAADGWRKRLPNSFNYAVATSERPLHSLKYSLGLKTYYPNSMFARYHQDGTLEFPHCGKLYASLHDARDFIDGTGARVNRLTHMELAGRVQLPREIAPEKEINFLSALPAGLVRHQMVTRFPSFKREWRQDAATDTERRWQQQMTIKYGLNRELYNFFRYLLRHTAPQLKLIRKKEIADRDERTEVLDLLSQYLCAYWEVHLLRVMCLMAADQGGVLVYFDKHRELSRTADTYILVSGSANQPTRDMVTIRRELRRQVARRLRLDRDSNKLISDPSKEGTLWQRFDAAHVRSVLTEIGNNSQNEQVQTYAVDLCKQIFAPSTFPAPDDKSVYISESTIAFRRAFWKAALQTASPSVLTAVPPIGALMSDQVYPERYEGRIRDGDPLQTFCRTRVAALGECAFITLHTTRTQVCDALYSLRDDANARAQLLDEMEEAFVAPHGDAAPLEALPGWLDLLAQLHHANGTDGAAAQQLRQQLCASHHYDHYVRESTRRLHLGRVSARLFAQASHLSLFIWRRSEPQPPDCTADRVRIQVCEHHTDPQARDVIHMLHTNRNTHFDLLFQEL